MFDNKWNDLKQIMIHLIISGIILSLKHTCQLHWIEFCEINQNFKGDLIKFCEITLELPQNNQKAFILL